VRLSELMKETLEFLQGILLQKQMKMDGAFIQRDEVLADKVQLKQAFLNVLLNSIEAMDHGGQITVSTSQRNGSVNLVIADTGPGIPKQDLQRVFDPFYTTKPRGTGLGLSVVHSIMREHGGDISIESEVGRGTAVQISLPIKGGDHGTHTHPHCG